MQLGRYRPIRHHLQKSGLTRSGAPSYRGAETTPSSDRRGERRVKTPQEHECCVSDTVILAFLRIIRAPSGLRLVAHQ